MRCDPEVLVRLWNSTGVFDHPPAPSGRRFAPEWERSAAFVMENQRISHENTIESYDTDGIPRFKRCMIQMVPIFFSHIHKYKLAEVYTQIASSCNLIDTGVKPLWLTKPPELPEEGFDLYWEEGCIKTTETILFEWYRRYVREERIVKIGFVCLDLNWPTGTILFKYFDLIKDVE